MVGEEIIHLAFTVHLLCDKLLPSRNKVCLRYQHLYYPDLHYESPKVLWNAAFPKLIQLLEEQKHSRSYQLLSTFCMSGALPKVHL